VRAPSFSVPSADERLAAIGDTGGLPERLRRALTSLDGFEPVSLPGPDDWLANHAEGGQSYEQWVRSRPNRPDRRRSVIYLWPLGELEPGESPDLDRLQRFASAFFAMPVVASPEQSLAEEFASGRVTTRRNPYGGQRQLLTSDILDALRRRLPGDAFALIGITMEDLYPEPSWNFVYGSNHLAESDARPMHLCPVDLRKLQDATGFDVTDRCRRLRDVCREFAFDDEARWLDERLAELAGVART
jgi:archaemetzincin